MFSFRGSQCIKTIGKVILGPQAMSFIERFIIQYPCYGGWFNYFLHVCGGREGLKLGGGGGESQDGPNNSVSPIAMKALSVQILSTLHAQSCSCLYKISTKASDAHVLATYLWSFTCLLNQSFLMGFHSSLNALTGKLHICMSSW